MYRALLIAIILSFASSCSPSPSKPELKKNSVPVNVVEVALSDHTRYIEAVGFLKPITLVEVRPQVSGILVEVNFNEGQLVSIGQPLFNIEASTYKIRLLESQAQRNRNFAALQAAKKKMDRFEGLAKKNLISHQEWDELSSEVEKHAAQLQADEAKEAAAELDLKYCCILAPIAGKTGRIAFHPGSLVNSSQPASLVSIACIERLLVEFSVTELQFLQLRQSGAANPAKEVEMNKLPMEVSSLKMPELSIKGMLTFSDYGFDSRSGLLLLRGEIKNESNYFLPGQSVNVRLAIESTKNSILIPEKAVKINHIGHYVYKIAEGNIAEVCQVRQGEEFKGQVTILEGLQAGDLIVTEGHLRLYPGASVELIKDFP